MRQIGSLPHQAQADRFTAYLITRGISAMAEEDGGAWLIWVRDEDQLDVAHQALREFILNPEDDRYRGAVREASQRLHQDARRREQARRNFVTMSDRWRKGGVRRHNPLVKAVIGLCIVVFLLINFGTVAYPALAFCDPVHEKDETWNPNRSWDRAIDIRRGEVWRLVTPSFMHQAVVHVAFNMIMFYWFGSQIEERRGALRLMLLILITAVASNAAQGLAPADWGTLSGTHKFLGLSGVVYGLLGYLWMKTVHDPGSGLYISSGTVTFLVIWMLLGFAGILEGAGMHIANLAHGVGMLTGMLCGYLGRDLL